MFSLLALISNSNFLDCFQLFSIGQMLSYLMAGTQSHKMGSGQIKNKQPIFVFHQYLTINNLKTLLKAELKEMLDKQGISESAQILAQIIKKWKV